MQNAQPSAYRWELQCSWFGKALGEAVLAMQTYRSFLFFLPGLATKQLPASFQDAFPPHPWFPALTIVAILLQVLLELVWAQAGVLVHPKVSQAFCRALSVCVLHPFWVDKGLPVQPCLSTLFHLWWFAAVFTLGPPPSPWSVALSNSGVLDWQKEQISAHMLGVLYHQRPRDWWTPPVTHASKFQHGRTWWGGMGGARGGAIGRWDGGLGQELGTRLWIW